MHTIIESKFAYQENNLKSGEILDNDLPWAIVEQPTTTGMRNGASMGLHGGEWVKGYYLDEGEQIPVITGRDWEKCTGTSIL